MSKKILIIEDEQPVLHALNEILSPEGYVLIETVTGEAGLKTALETHPDLIILDLLLPEMGGIEVFEKIREDDWGKNAQVLILTNLTHDEKERRAKELNVSEYIIKSNISVKSLARKIKEILGE